ncbi:MAG: hypothetical protein PHF67_01215 [Candidatus Nanoarchaeia archaeon]|nr:hypothetical protein [Candidatus Nanoarchaeia archaeon]
MKQKLFSILAFSIILATLVLPAISAQRYEDNYFRYGTIKPDGTLVTTNTPITNVNVIGFVCSSDNCQTVSGRLWPNILTSTSDFMRLVYPTTLQSQYGYGVYVYKEGYIPYEIAADWWGTNPNDPVGPYNDYLTRKEVCTSKVMSMDFDYLNNIIYVDTQVRAPVSSAGPLDYLPTELITIYSANAQTTLRIEKDNETIYTETRSLNFLPSELKDLTFSVPNITEPGTYIIKIYTTVNNEPKCLSFNQDSKQEILIIPEEPECDEASDCGTVHYSDNYCENDNVYRDKHQPVCDNGICGEIITKELVEECSSTCTNGQCDHQIVCDTNSDCGTDGCAGDPNYCIGDQIFQDFIYFTCNNPGTEQSYCSNQTSPFLMETCPEDSETANYCEGDNLYKDFHDFGCALGSCFEHVTKQLVEECANGCVNHACISLCSDNSECGTDGYVGERFCKADGNVYQNYKTFTCNNPDTSQSTCTFSIEERKVDDCEYGCENGECNQPECTDDDECPQGEFCVDNICVPPVCSNNSDCGTDGCAGDPNYCIGDQIFQDFIIFTCHNPGTKEAYCSDHLWPFLMETCPDNYYSNAYCENDNIYKDLHNFGCSLGSCFETTTQELFQTCANGCNTTTNTCNGQQITCVQDSNCGTDSYIGERFCKADGNVYQKYKDFTCNNPNTTQSTCTNNETDRLIQSCTNGCSNGVCNQQVCQNDSNCGNASSEFICRNGDVTEKITTPKCVFDNLTSTNKCENRITYELDEECEHGCKIDDGEAVCKSSSDSSSDNEICYDEDGDEIDCDTINEQTQTRRTTMNYEPEIYSSRTQTNQSSQTQNLNNLIQSRLNWNINYILYAITGLIALIAIILIIILLTRRKPRRKAK